MNKVILTGNLCKEYDVRQMPNGKKVASNSIACKRNYKNKNGEYESDFINIIAFEPTANYLTTYSAKGDKVEVIGRWQHRSYQAQDGSTKYVDECIAEEASLLASKKPQNTPQATQGPESIDIGTDDLPF